MAFDPDKYLAETAEPEARAQEPAPFDPDAYLAEKPAPAPSAAGSALKTLQHALVPSSAVSEAILEHPEQAQAGLEGFGNGASFGHLPHLQAASELAARKLGLDPSGGVDDALREQGFKLDEPGYTQMRDENIRRMQGERASFPKTFTAGELAGSVAAGAAIPTPLKMAGSGLVPAVVNGAQGGAIAGAITNPGDTEGEVQPLQPIERIKQAAAGGLTGAVLAAALQKLSAAAGSRGKTGLEGAGAAGKLQDFAEKKAFKSAGPIKRDFAEMNAKGMTNRLGRQMIDEGITSPLASPATVAERLEDASENAGQNVKDILARSQQEMDSQEATGTAPVTGFKPAGPELTNLELVPEKLKYGKAEPQAIPVSPPKTIDPELPAPFSKENPAGMNAGRQMQVHKDIDRANLAALKDSSFDPYAPNPEVQVAPVETEHGFQQSGNFQPIEPRSAYRIDASKIADQIRSSPEYRMLRKTPGLESAASRIDGLLETLANNGEEMTLSDSLALRQSIDRGINFSKRVPEMQPAQLFLYKIRDALRDRMNDAVNLSNVADKDALMAANRRYSGLKTMQDIAEEGNARAQANRAFGLTDTIHSAGGASAGATFGAATGVPGAAKAGAATFGAAAGLGNKFARTYGNSLMSSGAENASKMVAAVPGAAKSAQNPTIAALVQRGVMGQQDDVDTRSLGPDFMQKFRDRPELLDRIQNPKLREAIQRKLNQERSPAGRSQEEPVSGDEARRMYNEGN